MEIEASFIVEMIGRPKDYLKDTIDQFITVLGTEPNISIIKKKVHDPKKIDTKEKVPADKEMFSTFAEIDLKCELDKMLFIISKYMPSHIEIINPESIRITNSEFSMIMTEFARRLHKYDEIAKSAIMKNQILENQLRRFQPNGIVLPQAPLNKAPSDNSEKVTKKAVKKKRK